MTTAYILSCRKYNEVEIKKIVWSTSKSGQGRPQSICSLFEPIYHFKQSNSISPKDLRFHMFCTSDR